MRRLGAGAIGVVYEAEQVSMNRRVAMKMLSSKSSANPMLVQRFQREAKLSAQISHPHVVQVFDCGFERSVHFLTMELVDGTTLAGMVDENGPMPWQQASALMLQVARAVDHVAGQNIVPPRHQAGQHSWSVLRARRSSPISAWPSRPTPTRAATRR